MGGRHSRINRPFQRDLPWQRDLSTGLGGWVRRRSVPIKFESQSLERVWSLGGFLVVESWQARERPETAPCLGLTLQRPKSSCAEEKKTPFPSSNLCGH